MFFDPREKLREELQKIREEHQQRSKIRIKNKSDSKLRIDDKSKLAVQLLHKEKGKLLKILSDYIATKKVQESLSYFFNPGKKLKQTWLNNFKEDQVKIWSWNVNGIRPVISKGILSSFFKKHDPIILWINETKVDERTLENENLKSVIPKEYVQYWNWCKPPIKGYAGTAVFTKVKPLKVIYDLGIDTLDCEGRTITLEFEKFYLVCTYVPNASQKLKRLDYRINEWDQGFQNYIQKLEKNGKPVIISGDLNVAHNEIDIHNPKGNAKNPGFTLEERESFSTFLEKGFVDTFRYLHPDEIKYSYWSMRTGKRTTNQGWRLDYFVTSRGIIDQVIESHIHDDVHGSDHCPVSLDLDLKDIDLETFQSQSELK